MLLAIDIGNTSITLGILKAKKVAKKVQIDSGLKQAILKEKLKKALKKLDNQYAPEDVVICSVVPHVLKIVESAVKMQTGKKVLVVGRDIKVGIKNCYRNPRQVGQDRLVGAYAALNLYGKPAIVIDLGTAITFDVVSGKKEYLGGIIVPGIRLSAESLYQKTALLPRINIYKPPQLIGKDTEGSILSGIFYGYGEMIKGLVSKIAKNIEGRPKIIVTGGHANIMKKFIHKKIDVIDPDLVLKGMFLLMR